ncbi:(Fe-S)-binding protein [Desulfomonile tiedjei]|uniref:CO dehydrogenase/acetyl-CoA synthase gamma subunit (Corrinoid Fe-S protein) n=1 Tax=Desulfomonile tiedjei (strain ATCC 49306 / DSM 6799 / DCB-1) TaxID=706587 RepID=I4C599_DESTA|nr:(Fe-S)-binding protein [Desulfomonile tiedjei]AFM24740.1 CO dehydrogenase/acetyl-CoA synthase gamma subunit (corrinoid Fe-S protein) [Desulfomonile tiedjei DSM 6799]
MIEQEFADIYPLTTESLLEYLPDVDCTECGYSSCRAFAEALIKGNPASWRCPELNDETASVLRNLMNFVPPAIPFNVMMESLSPGLISVRLPVASSPVLVTCNFRETVHLLENVLDSCGMSVFILVSDTKGYSVDNAVEEKRFTPFEILKVITETAVGSMANHRSLVIPGLARHLAGQIKQVTGWQVMVGPVSGLELPLFLLKEGLIGQ